MKPWVSRHLCCLCMGSSCQARVGRRLALFCAVVGPTLTQAEPRVGSGSSMPHSPSNGRQSTCFTDQRPSLEKPHDFIRGQKATVWLLVRSNCFPEADRDFLSWNVLSEGQEACYRNTFFFFLRERKIEHFTVHSRIVSDTIM